MLRLLLALFGFVGNDGALRGLRELRELALRLVLEVLGELDGVESQTGSSRAARR